MKGGLYALKEDREYAFPLLIFLIVYFILLLIFFVMDFLIRCGILFNLVALVELEDFVCSLANNEWMLSLLPFVPPVAFYSSLISAFQQAAVFRLMLPAFSHPFLRFLYDYSHEAGQ